MADEGTLQITQGVDFEAYFEPYEDSTLTTRTDLASADWLIVFQVRSSRGACSLLLNLDSDDEQGRLAVEAAVDPPTGDVVHIDLRADDTAAIATSGTWELTRVDRNDVTNVSLLGSGLIDLERRITDATQAPDE